MAGGKTRVKVGLGQAVGALVANEWFYDVEKLEKKTDRTPFEDLELDFIKKRRKENEEMSNDGWAPLGVGALAGAWAIGMTGGLPVAGGVMTVSGLGLFSFTIPVLWPIAAVLLTAAAFTYYKATRNVENNEKFEGYLAPDDPDIYTKIRDWNFTGERDANGNLTTIKVNASFDDDLYADSTIKWSKPTLVGAAATAVDDYEKTRRVRDFGDGVKEVVITDRQIKKLATPPDPAKNKGNVHTQTTIRTYPVEITAPIPTALSTHVIPGSSPPAFQNKKVVETDGNGRILKVIEILYDDENKRTKKSVEEYKPPVTRDEIDAGVRPKKHEIELADFSYDPTREKKVTIEKDSVTIFEKGPDPADPDNVKVVKTVATNGKNVIKTAVTDEFGTVISGPDTYERTRKEAKFDEISEHNTRVRESKSEEQGTSFTQRFISEPGYIATVGLILSGLWPAALALGIVTEVSRRISGRVEGLDRQNDDDMVPRGVS